MGAAWGGGLDKRVKNIEIKPTQYRRRTSIRPLRVKRAIMRRIEITNV